ncbi:MAG TPA: hemolysin family protein [Chitinophagales bacterium]|nr:hemolysin family protein [Chitinophagales bacterium]
MEIFLIFFLILLNGVFSMSEIAIVSSRRSRLEAAAKRGDKNARAALDTANSPNKFLSTVQIGITLIGILTGIFSGEKITDDLTKYLESFALIQPYAETIAVGIVVVILTFFSLVIGELVPKRIGLSNPEFFAKLVARPMQVLSVITAPFVWLLTATSDVLITLFRIKPSSDTKVTEEEIKAIIQEGTEGGAIQEIEQDIMHRVFSLGDRKISSLMTHRSDAVFLKSEFDAAAIRKAVNAEMHSIYPVTDENEKLMGIVLLKDLFKNITDPGFKLAHHIRTPKFFSPNISAYEALRQFKTTKIHQAIVVDEYGQMQGIIAMNDLLKALVGDVSDFYSSEFAFVQRQDGSWLVDGQFPFTELLHKFDMNELATEHKFDTISGLILNELEKIPRPGDRLSWQCFDIEVMDMDGARIDKILLSLKKE